LPLLMMTDSKLEMGDRFKNSWWLKILGWISVIALTGLNLEGMPEQVQGFFGSNVTGAKLALANDIAYVLIFAVLALLAWTIVELHRGNKRLAIARAAEAKAAETTEGGR